MNRYLVTASATYEVIADTPEEAESIMAGMVRNEALRYELTVHDEGCAHTRTGGVSRLSCSQVEVTA